MIGNPARLIGRAEVTHDHIANNAYNGAPDKRGKRSRQWFFLVSGLYQHGQHGNRIAEEPIQFQSNAPGTQKFLLCSPFGNRNNFLSAR